MGDTSFQCYDSEDEDSISRCSSVTSSTLTVTPNSLYSSSQCNVSRKYSEDLNVNSAYCITCLHFKCFVYNKMYVYVLLFVSST